MQIFCLNKDIFSIIDFSTGRIMVGGPYQTSLLDQ